MEKTYAFWRKTSAQYSGLSDTPIHALEDAFMQTYVKLKNNPALNEPKEREGRLLNREQQQFIYAAIGLLAYGQLDVAESIFDQLPPRPSSHEGLIPGTTSYSLQQLLPLPEKFLNNWYLRENPQEAKAWFQQNRDCIVWDEDQGKFVLKP